MIYVLLIVVFFISIGLLGADYEAQKKPENKGVSLLSSRGRIITMILAGASLVLFLVKLNAPKEESPKTGIANEYNQSIVKPEVQRELEKRGVVCLDAGIIDDRSLWVYIMDTGQNMDNVASTLCPLAKRYNAKMVSIFDAKQKRLGQSFCN